MVGTLWAFLPAIIAIVLALVTKQVYVSLFLGVFVGAMMYVGGNPIAALQTVYEIMSDKVGGNVSIIVFLVVLGIRKRYFLSCVTGLQRGDRNIFLTNSRLLNNQQYYS